MEIVFYDEKTSNECKCRVKSCDCELSVAQTKRILKILGDDLSDVRCFARKEIPGAIPLISFIGFELQSYWGGSQLKYYIELTGHLDG
jgi:hypothetical protein